MQRLILATVGLLLFLVSSEGWGASSGGRTAPYVDAHWGFSIDLPHTWEILPHARAALLAAAPKAPRQAQFRPNLNLIVDYVEEEYTLQQLVSMNINYAKGALLQFRILSVDTIGRQQAPMTRIVYTCRLISRGQAYDVQNSVYCLLAESKFYILTCCCAREQHEEYADLFDRVSDTLRPF